MREQYSAGNLLTALFILGLVLSASMTFLLVFPIKVRAPPGIPITIPNGVSSDPLLNFVTPTLTVARGATVQWINKDSAPHTATATSVPSGTVKFDSGELDGGDAFSVTFTVPGNYSYHCFFHPGWMKGRITVNP